MKYTDYIKKLIDCNNDQELRIIKLEQELAYYKQLFEEMKSIKRELEKLKQQR